MSDFNRNNKFDRKTPGRFHDESSKRFGRSNSPRFERRDSGRFEGRDSERSFEKRMHSAVCAKCGERCEVPFRPTGDKPVYCSNCFRKDGDYEPRERRAPVRNEFDQINEKLDKIMKALKIG